MKECRGFYFPPHPAPNSRIRREDLKMYEGMGVFFAQRKFNGVHLVIYVGNGKMQIWDRRGECPKVYALTANMVQCFSKLHINAAREYVFAGELLHNKAKSKITNEQAATNTIVLFDVLYAEKYLDELNGMERQKILSDICNNPTEKEEKGRALKVAESSSSSLWRAENFPDDFLYHFDEMYDFHPTTKEDMYPEIEGLMLRHKSGMLLPGDRITDVNWLVRCRKAKDDIYKF